MEFSVPRLQPHWLLPHLTLVPLCTVHRSVGTNDLVRIAQLKNTGNARIAETQGA
jgi:hypothetical protein